MNDMRQRLLEMERKNLIGKLITLIQLLVSVICIVTVAGSGMLPKKYLIFLIGALAHISCSIRRIRCCAIRV